MGFYKFNAEGAMNAGGGVAGKKVVDTGVYDVTINTVSQVTASTGTKGYDINYTIDGAKYPNMIYGMWTEKANGDRIFNMDLIDAMMAAVGVKELTSYKKKVATKDGEKTVDAVKEFDNKKVKFAIQKCYDVYNGEPTEKNELKCVFNTEGKTYAEAVKKTEAKSIKYYQEKFKDKESDAYKKFIAEVDAASGDDIEVSEDGHSIL